jgi:hypothetical protein
MGRFMKLLLIIVSILICATTTNAQREVKLDELKEHIGDSVKVHGKISGVEYSSSSKQKSMIIYVGEKYPKHALTIFISPDVLSKLHIVPSRLDAGNIMFVSGKVERYKGKTRMSIKDALQLDIIDNWQGELE